MHRQEAMRHSTTHSICQTQDGTRITGPSASVPGYDVTIETVFLLFCAVPSETAVQRILEEFAVPRDGWTAGE